jgi:hypothetical protein
VTVAFSTYNVVGSLNTIYPFRVVTLMVFSAVSRLIPHFLERAVAVVGGCCSPVMVDPINPTLIAEESRWYRW